MSETKKIPWYKNVTFWGDAATSLGSIGMLFSPHTTAYKVGAGVTIATGLITRWFSKSKEKYEKDQLPEGLSKRVMDKLPNKVTGIKGSKK